MNIETDLLRKASERTDQLLERAEQYRSRVDIVNKTAHFTAQHKAELRRQEKANFEAAYREHVLEARRLLDEAHAKASKRLAAPATDEAGESRRTRSASRVDRMLGAGMAPAAVIEALVEAEDLSGLQALREELPSWAAVTFASEPQVRRKTTVESLRLAVDRAMRPFLADDLAAAVDVRLQVDDERARLDATVDHVWSNSAASRIRLAFAESPPPTVQNGHLDTSPAA